MLPTVMNLRLLLVEDDPVSQVFLAEAARNLPVAVICAASIAEACRAAQAHAFDAWLIDARLPDGSGIELLAKLQQIHDGSIPTLAHTASKDPQRLAELKDAGFNLVVSKPLTADDWCAALRRLLNLDLETEAAVTADWDDAGALRALNGNNEALKTLRSLFAKELPQQYRKIIAALEAAEIDTALGELHRMKASCAFVGASALQQAVIALHAEPASQSARQAFVLAVEKNLMSAPPRSSASI